MPHAPHQLTLAMWMPLRTIAWLHHPSLRPHSPTSRCLPSSLPKWSAVSPPPSALHVQFQLEFLIAKCVSMAPQVQARPLRTACLDSRGVGAGQLPQKSLRILTANQYYPCKVWFHNDSDSRATKLTSPLILTNVNAWDKSSNTMSPCVLASFGKQRSTSREFCAPAKKESIA
jgi:hypothetical protein